MNQPLDSYANTLSCLENLAGNEADQLSFAQSYGFDDWQNVDTFCRRAGVLVDDNTVVFRRQLSVSREDAWPFISQPQYLAKWHIPTEWDFREGGRFEFKNAWQGYIEVLRPGWLIKFKADAGGFTSFEFAVSEYMTEFVLTDYMGPEVVVPEHVLSESDSIAGQQPGGPGTHWHGVLAGWHCGIDALQALLAGSAVELPYDRHTAIYDVLLHARYDSSSPT